MKKRNVRFVVILLVAALCCSAYFAWDYFGNKEEKVSYVDFWQCVEAGDVTSVKFDGDKIHFTVVECPSGRIETTGAPVISSAISANSSGSSSFPRFFPLRRVVPAQIEQSAVARVIES